jgi:ribonuclease D
MAVTLHEGDLPDGLDLGPVVAVDTETMGLKPRRDRLCLVQLSAGDGNAHLVRLAPGDYDAPNLTAMLGDAGVTKLFHFARFDVAMIERYLGVVARPLYCTKISSKLARTFTDRHGLRDLCRDLLGIDLAKEQQMSDWGSAGLSERQLAYAASDVLHLHDIRARLDDMLAREGRAELAEACFRFVPMRARLDLAGWDDVDIFAH